MQCGGASGQCWCVDKDGREIPGTRTTRNLQCPDPGNCCVINQTPLLDLCPWKLYIPRGGRLSERKATQTITETATYLLRYFFFF